MDIIEQLSQKLSLSPTFRSEFMKRVEVIHLPKKRFFINQGQICNYIGLVTEGGLFASIQTDTGDEVVNEFYLPNSFVTSYRSFLTRCPSPGSIQAYSDSTLYAISYETYRAVEQSLDWALFFKHMSEALFIEKCLRTTSLLSESAVERYANLIVNRPGLEQHFPQFLIASYLNIRPETLSRIKSLDLHQVKAHKRGPTFGA